MSFPDPQTATGVPLRQFFDRSFEAVRVGDRASLGAVKPTPLHDPTAGDAAPAVLVLALGCLTATPASGIRLARLHDAVLVPLAVAPESVNLALVVRSVGWDSKADHGAVAVRVRVRDQDDRLLARLSLEFHWPALDPARCSKQQLEPSARPRSPRPPRRVREAIAQTRD